MATSLGSSRESKSRPPMAGADAPPSSSNHRSAAGQSLNLSHLLFLVCVLRFVFPTARAAELALKVSAKEAPEEVEESIRKLLEPRTVQLAEGDKPTFEFWFRTEVPLQKKPESLAKSLDAVKQTTLLGVVSVPNTQRDYRDDELTAGVYTMRFALQPQDGNHLGTAEFPYFAVLVPAKTDRKLDDLGTYKQLVKASSRETSTDHPVILSLRPAPSEAGSFPRLDEPAPEHKSVLVKLPARMAEGDQKSALIFEVVYQGKGKK
jgi:hypothetical protein